MKKVLKIIAATLISVVIAIALVYTHKKQEAEKLESIRMSEIRESINESIQESREIEINSRVAELKKEIKQKIENNKLEGKTISFIIFVLHLFVEHDIFTTLLCIKL